MKWSMPDLDVLYPFADPVSAFTWHRGPSHSIFVLAALTPLVVWLILKLHPGTAEQDSVVRGHYGARLVVMNIGDTFTTGPKEAAYVVNELIKPAAVIASHANEPATEGGKVIASTKTETFIEASAVPVHVPLGSLRIKIYHCVR